MIQDPSNEANREVLLARRLPPSEPALRAAAAPFTVDSGVPEETFSFLLEYWELLRRSQWILAAFAAFGIFVALLYTLAQVPIYQADTTIELQGLNLNFLNLKSADPTTDMPDYSGDEVVRTQIKILESNSLRKRVIAKVTEGPRQAPDTGRDPLASWRKMLGMNRLRAPLSHDASVAYAAGHTAIQAAEGSRIIEIVADSPDPSVAEAVANSWAQEYIDQNLESRWKTTQYTGEWLTKQIEGLRTNLESSESALREFGLSSGLMFTEEKNSVSEEKLRQLQQELLKAEAERAVKQSQYEISLTASADALPEVLDDPALKEYQTALVRLHGQKAELSATLTPEHYKMQKIEEQIRQLLSEIEHTRFNVVQRIQAEYEAAKRRVELIHTDYIQQVQLVTDQGAKLTHYELLKRDVDTNRQIYDSMLQKVKEVGITSAMRASNARIVDPAEAPTSPYKPDTKRNTALGLMGGFLAGCCLVTLRERVDRRIKAPSDLHGYLNLPDLGSIPNSKSVFAVKGQAYGNGARNPAVNGSTTPARSERLELVVAQQSQSLLAEGFRTVLASILFSGRSISEHPKVIVVTSAGPGEGKTTTTSNLALAVAETRWRVLLIDGDLRRPRMHEIFGVPNTYGLSDVLESNDIETAWRRAVVETSNSRLMLMPSGSPSHNVSTLLYSAQLPELLHLMRRHFDAVLIDTPPILALPDARILAKLTDGVVLVVRSGKTTRDSARLASRRLQQDGTPVLGTLLNDWSPESMSSYGYQSYSAKQDDGKSNAPDA
jgi:polysaccharide biosynthesis transport protein